MGCKKKETFADCVERLKCAERGAEIRDALVTALELRNASINVSMPTNCPNCGGVVSGNSANCEFCGTLLIWR